MVNGAQLIARGLVSAGVRRVFSLSGNQVLSLYEALDREGIAITHTRHEGAAVHMADAWARLTGEVGVCLVTAGPGHANALGALAMAESGESPLVLLSGHAPREHVGAATALSGQAKAGSFQAMDQVALARPLSRWAEVATDAAQLPSLLQSAFARARCGRAGPVSLSLPVNVLESTVPNEGAHMAASTGPSDPPLQDARPFREIVAKLRAAARPLILAGPSAARSSLHAALVAFCTHTHVPLLVVDHPRGLTDPALGRAAQALPWADTVLLFGKTQDYRIGYGAALAGGCGLLQIDPVKEEIGRYRAPEIGIVADLKAAVAQLIEAAHAPDAAPWPGSDWAAEVRELVETPVFSASVEVGDTSDGIHPWRVLDMLAQVIDERGGREVCLVFDGGEFGQWARARLAARLQREAPRHLVNEPSGAIGYAVPFAIAAKLVRPAATVVAVAGDGAFGFYAMELETAARAGAPILMVVGNDGAWGTERHLQRARYGPDRAVATDLLPARYDLLAQALGGEGELVTEGESLRPAFERAYAAVAAGRVCLVNARIRSVASPAGAPP